MIWLGRRNAGASALWDRAPEASGFGSEASPSETCSSGRDSCAGVRDRAGLLNAALKRRSLSARRSASSSEMRRSRSASCVFFSRSMSSKRARVTKGQFILFTVTLSSCKGSWGLCFLSRVQIKTMEVVTVSNIEGISTDRRYAEKGLSLNRPIQFAG